MTDNTSPNFKTNNGDIIRYDVAQGPLDVTDFDNDGILELYSSSPEVDSAEIVASTFKNLGAIRSDLHRISIRTPLIASEGGSITAKEVAVHSDESATVIGGTFNCEQFRVFTQGKAEIHAERINGELHIKACDLVVGVRAGDLNIASQELSGDPIYYNGSGSVSVSAPASGGRDIYAIATGDVTIGAIDATGTSAGMPAEGKVLLIAGCDYVTYNGVAGPGTVSCNDCSRNANPFFDYSFPTVPTNSVTVSGDINAKDLTIHGGTVTINGNINLDAENYTLGGSGTITYADTATVNGSITCTKYGGGLGGFSISGGLADVGGDITVTGSIEGDAGLAAGAGNIFVGGTITAEQVIDLSAGNPNPFADCGGGSVAEWKSKRLALLTPGCTIQAPALTAKLHIWAFATGDISLGDVTLADDDTGEWSPAGHDVRVYANMGAESAAAFALGAGGTNGCTSISNTGITTQSDNGGVVYIYNPGGIDVTVAALDLVKNVDGVPGLVLSAEDGEITLDGDLNVDGDSSTGAGYIAILAGKLTLSGATTLSASDTMASPEPISPAIAIAASDIPVNGNIVIQCNGYTDTFVGVGPTDSLNIPLCPYFIARPVSLEQVGGETKLEGSGNIQITANSEYGRTYLLGTPLRLNAGTVELKSQGNFSTVEIAYDGSPSGAASLISTGGGVTLDADNPDGDGGNVIVTADTINVTSALNMHADALSSGNGGVIYVIADGGNLSVDGGSAGLTVSADGAGSGKAAGSISFSASGELHLTGAAIGLVPGIDGVGGTITAYASEDITIEGTLAAEGNGSGSGGSINLTSDAALDLSNASLSANGGDTGDGGIINLAYSSTDEQTIKDLTATGSSNGGAITIVNNGSFDLVVSVSGNIDTSINAGETLAGSTTLVVSDAQSFGINFHIGASGGFNSFLTAEAAAVTVNAEPVVSLGLNAITANVGDVDITANADGGVALSSQGLQPASALTTIAGPITAPAGGINLQLFDVFALDSVEDRVIIFGRSGTTVSLKLRTFLFGANTYIEGVSGNVEFVGPYDGGITVALRGGGMGGFKSCVRVDIKSGPTAAGDAPIVFTALGGSGMVPTLVANVTGSPGLFNITAHGDVAIGVNIGGLSGGQVDDSISPDYLDITGATVNFIDLTAGSGAAYVNKDTSVTASGNVDLGPVRSGSGSQAGSLTVTGDDVNFNASVITRGPISATASGNLDTSNTVMQALDNGGSPAAGIVLAASGALVIGQTTMTAYASIQLISGALLRFDGASVNATALSGSGSDIVALAGTLLTVDTFSALDAKGSIYLSIGRAAVKVPGTDDPAGRPVSVSGTEVHVTSPGVLYWGSIAPGNLTISGSNHNFTANGKELVFDANGNLLTVAGNTSISAHT